MNSSNPFSTPPVDDNPYRSSTVEAPAATAVKSPAEKIREQHLNHEASIKGIGSLYLMGAGFWLVMGIVMLASIAMGNGAMSTLVIWAVSIPMIVLLGVAGFGLRGLYPWSKWTAALISTFSLAAAPFGTLISFYVLYLVFSKKGQVVFSPEYQHVITQTPHIRYKTSIIVWLVLGLFVLVLLSLVFVGLSAA